MHQRQVPKQFVSLPETLCFAGETSCFHMRNKSGTPSCRYSLPCIKMMVNAPQFFPGHAWHGCPVYVFPYFFASRAEICCVFLCPNPNFHGIRLFLRRIGTTFEKESVSLQKEIAQIAWQQRRNH
jgi:hypothetical protein